MIFFSTNTYAGVESFRTVTDKYDRTIRIVGDRHYPPYEFIDESGNYKGFNVDIMRAIAIEMGLDIEIIPMQWNEALMALQNGEADVIQGMTKSNIREKIFLFSNELITNSQVIFVRKDTNFINDIKDFTGVKVAFQKGDINYEIINTIPDIKPVVKDNQQLGIESLINGEVDAFVGNRLTGLYYLQKEKKLEEIKIVGDPMYITQYSSVSLKENENIIKILNEGIERIKSNGTYDKIYKKWFGETFRDGSVFWKRLLYIAIFIILCAATITSTVIYWNSKLKKQVDIRTKELEFQKEKLYHSNRLRGKILEGIVSGIITFDNEGNVLESNKASNRILEKDINLGTNYKELHLEEKLKINIFDGIKNNKILEKNVELTKKTGDKIYLDCRLLPIGGPGGTEGGILLLHDYTKEKKYQNLINHNDKMQALGKLSAGIAHELRNPLTSIKGFIDLIPSKFENKNFRKSLIKICGDEISRLNSLVSVLLDYSNPKASEPSIVNLEDMINDILLLFSVKLKKSKVRVINNSSDLKLWVDKYQLKQVLINVILNSIDSFEKEGTINIESFKVKDKVIIEISDDGCGIPEEIIDKIFNPFFSNKKKGYGIGLSICHQLIKENKGDISVESIKGGGTTMTITVPSATEKGEEVHA